MGSRRNARLIYDERVRQDTGMMHRGPLPATHYKPFPPPAILEHTLASQAAEMQQLARDNQKLVAGQMSLRQDLAAAAGEIEKLREHMGSIQTESDIQIRILLDKIAKREAEIEAGDNIKGKLQEAHIEARSVMTSKLELSVKIEQATKELAYSRAKIKELPEIRAQLDSLKQEYKKLRKTFEYEKSLNTEKVEQMRILEKDLIGKVEEVESLRAEVFNAEKRAIVPIPYGGPYMHPDKSCLPTFYANGGGYADSFGRPHFQTVHGAPVETMYPYANGRLAVGPQVISGPVGSAGDGVGGDNAASHKRIT